jgi:hypothetical protein
VVGRGQHLAEVLAGGERRPGAGDDDAAELGVGLGAEQRIARGVPQLVVHGVPRLGTVPGDEADAVGVVDRDGGGRHV